MDFKLPIWRVKMKKSHQTFLKIDTKPPQTIYKPNCNSFGPKLEGELVPKLEVKQNSVCLHLESLSPHLLKCLKFKKRSCDNVFTTFICMTTQNYRKISVTLKRQLTCRFSEVFSSTQSYSNAKIRKFYNRFLELQTKTLKKRKLHFSSMCS